MPDDTSSHGTTRSQGSAASELAIPRDPLNEDTVTLTAYNLPTGFFGIITTLGSLPIAAAIPHPWDLAVLSGGTALGRITDYVLEAKERAAQAEGHPGRFHSSFADSGADSFPGDFDRQSVEFADAAFKSTIGVAGFAVTAASLASLGCPTMVSVPCAMVAESLINHPQAWGLVRRRHDSETDAEQGGESQNAGQGAEAL